MSDVHPKMKPDDVIQRLINENNQHATLMNEIKLMLSSEPEFDGMTMVGGVKALLKRFRETKDKVFDLENKQKIRNKQKKYSAIIMSELMNNTKISKYPTLKEAFIEEIAFNVANNYVKKVANRNNKELFRKLAGVSKIIVRLYEMGLSPTDALKRMESIFRKYPDLNPEQGVDSIGVKMFIQTMIKNKQDSGNAKRFYDNVINALLRTKYKKNKL